MRKSLLQGYPGQDEKQHSLQSAKQVPNQIPPI